MTEDTDAKAERFPRRSLRRQKTHAGILKAALGEFRRTGYAATTMNAIAEAADVHVTTLFTHFKSKRDLAASLNDSSIHRLERLIGEAKGRRPFFQFFREIVLATVKLLLDEGDPTMTMWREANQDPELTMAWVRYEQRQVEMLADYIAADYELDVEIDYRPSLVAHILITSGLISHRRWVDAPETLDLERETLAALAVAEQMAMSVLPPRS